MHRRYAFGGLTPPAAATVFSNPPLITKYRVGGWRLDGWIWMPRAGARRGLGARLMVGWSVGSGDGVPPLRRGLLGLAYSTALLLAAARMNQSHLVVGPHKFMTASQTYLRIRMRSEFELVYQHHTSCYLLSGKAQRCISTRLSSQTLASCFHERRRIDACADDA